MKQHDVVVIGGGLAGLTAALYLARAGRRVRLLEASHNLGGRARSTVHEEGIWNLGAHALYNGGAGRRVLDELGITAPGGSVDPTGQLAIVGDRLHALPVGFMSLMSTSLLDLGDKLALAKQMARLPRLDASSFEGSFGALVDELIDRPNARDVLVALGRLTTYGHVRTLPAAEVVRQLQRVLAEGVRYVGGGWQTMVDGLVAAARQAGVTIELCARVASLRGLGNADVVLAVPPAAASKLLGRRFDLRPRRAACLDLTVAGLPEPRRWFALGIDRPTYVAVASRRGAFAPEGKDVVHAVKYLDDAGDPATDRAELEACIDLLQPGWRDRVVAERFLPSLTVVHATPGERPAVEQDGVFLAGDWVGDEGMLADAAFASARLAAHRILAAPPISPSSRACAE